MQDRKNVSAAILIIGNEILSGITQDQNVKFIAQRLVLKGIDLKEVRIIPDIEEEIIQNVNYLRNKYNYIFTTGGIGPTHDDITTMSVAKAFGVKLVKNQQIYKDIKNYYKERGQEMNSAREKMSLIPENAELISSNITVAPGFFIENLFVMAGIPKIMNDMFEFVEGKLETLSPILIKRYIVHASESSIAELLTKLQNNYYKVDIGSYPFTKEGDYYTDIVFKAKDAKLLDECMKEFRENLEKLNIDYA